VSIRLENSQIADLKQITLSKTFRAPSSMTRTRYLAYKENMKISRLSDISYVTVLKNTNCYDQKVCVHKERNWKGCILYHSCICLYVFMCVYVRGCLFARARTYRRREIPQQPQEIILLSLLVGCRNSGCPWKPKVAVCSLNTKIRNDSFKVTFLPARKLKMVQTCYQEPG
jgi:hypothetical protein